MRTPSTSPQAALDHARLDHARAYVDQDDVDAVAAVLLGAQGSEGALARFEAGLLQATGAPHAVAVVNATAALHLAYHVLGIGPGRDVLTSANACLGTASAAHLCGAAVEFLDIDARTGNLDLRLLEERLERGRRPQVVTAGHYAGLPCDMEWLIALKRRHDFALVEDATQALGARYRVEGQWYRVGEHPEVEATVLSFHAHQHVTTGEGGAVLTHDAARAARLRRLRAHGVDPESNLQPFGEGRSESPAQKHPEHPAQKHPWFQPMLELGFHYGMSDMQAALGASQLKKLPDFLSARREIALRYLAELRGFQLPHPGGLGENADKEHAWNLFVIGCERGERDDLMLALRQRRIHGAVHHYPVPLEPWFRGRGGERAFPNACAHAQRVLSLPIYPALSEADQERVIAALAEWKRERSVA